MNRLKVPKKWLLVLLCIGVLISFACDAQAKRTKRQHKAHVHGDGKLNLVIGGQELHIELELPAMDVLGFGHLPKSFAQKERWQQAKQKLEKTENVLLIPGEANCQDAFIHAKQNLIGKKHNPKGHGHEKGGAHSEVQVYYKYFCSKPAALNSVSLVVQEAKHKKGHDQQKVFAAFPSVHKLHAQIVSPGKKTGMVLTPENATMGGLY